MNDSSIAPSPWFCSAHLLKFGILCFKDPRRERKVRTAWYFHMLSHTFTYFHILSHTSSTGYIYFGSTQEHTSTLQLRTSPLGNFSQWNSNLAQNDSSNINNTKNRLSYDNNTIIDYNDNTMIIMIIIIVVLSSSSIIKPCHCYHDYKR